MFVKVIDGYNPPPSLAYSFIWPVTIYGNVCRLIITHFNTGKYDTSCFLAASYMWGLNSLLLFLGYMQRLAVSALYHVYFDITSSPIMS